MAAITVNGKTKEIPDGSRIQQACEELGIPFSCKHGVCGSCLSTVKEGEENLGELNEQEKEFGLSDKHTRLACQCTIKSGNVTLESAY